MKLKPLIVLLLFCLFAAGAYAQIAGEKELNTAMGHYHNKEYPQAVTWFEKAANLGNTTAQYNLAICYEDGKGVAASQETANNWYIKAATLGYAKAQNTVGAMYESGKMIKLSYTDAAAWYKKAADQNYAMAQNNLGVLYDGGLGVEQSYTDALKYYQLAAAQGYAKAMFNIGVLYFKGLGVTASRPDAVKYWEQAANNGYTPAMAILGGYYELLEPNKNGYKKALDWFIKGAQNQDGYAAYQCGLLADNGLGTERNVDFAKKAYALAVALGNEPAKLALAELEAEPAIQTQQIKEKPKRRERQAVEITCMSCFGSGKIHKTIVGGGYTLDKYGNKTTTFGEYSTCYSCGGKGTVTKFL